MFAYDHRKIEPKWQKFWEEQKLYCAKDFSKKKKFYVLIEFPYLSGERLHVGHGRSYVGLDVLARKRRLQGQNVLYPIGWDAFGLPAENYAIKTGIHPSVTVTQNRQNAKKQAKSWGLSFDWDREINTTDPRYYKWTQWIFLKLLEKGLAYRAEIPVNWCPECKINLANEEVIAGTCERCHAPTTHRLRKQWLLRITAYADRLLDDLAKVDYRQDIKRQQIKWIGRKEGINITYKVQGIKETVTCFTTTPVNFGATFIVVAPEHELIRRILSGRIHVSSLKRQEVDQYVGTSKSKSELERISEGRAKTGVFTGLYAINHVTGEDIPIWISNFVLASIGTGAVQGCPGHDLRDFEFAKKFGLPIRRVVTGSNGGTGPIEKAEDVVVAGSKGKMVNSDFLNGMEFAGAMQKTMDYFEEKGWGKRGVTYHLRDWVFSRQHYWGEPIPVIYCRQCLENSKLMTMIEDGVEYAIIPVSEEQLPVELPYVESYQPTDTGESPLAKIESWVKTVCPRCGGEARRETDTMPNWAGSSWYFLRYIDPGNDQQLASRLKLKYWLPVDWYNGGMEHTTLHLLYSRFWHKFLFDIGVVPTDEPYAKRSSHGVIIGPDGYRMSKSRGNVVNPDEVVRDYGADTFRLYEMFIGPFEETVTWNPRGVVGVRRFLVRLWEIFYDPRKEARSSLPFLQMRLSELIQKLNDDVESLKFNTAISALMEFVNDWGRGGRSLSRADKKRFVVILAPFAPHLAEEFWSSWSSKKSVHQQRWPTVRRAMKKIETLVVQVDGKYKGKLDVARGTPKEEIESQAIQLESVRRKTSGGVARIVYVPGRLINFVSQT